MPRRNGSRYLEVKGELQSAGQSGDVRALLARGSPVTKLPRQALAPTLASRHAELIRIDWLTAVKPYRALRSRTDRVARLNDYRVAPAPTASCICRASICFAVLAHSCPMRTPMKTPMHGRAPRESGLNRIPASILPRNIADDRSPHLRRRTPRHQRFRGCSAGDR